MISGFVEGARCNWVLVLAVERYLVWGGEQGKVVNLS